MCVCVCVHVRSFSCGFLMLTKSERVSLLDGGFMAAFVYISP